MNFDDWLPGYEHVYKTGVFNVAEVDSEIVGVCNGVIRDRRFFHRLLDDARAAGCWCGWPADSKNLG